MAIPKTPTVTSEKPLLLVDDDDTFRELLGNALSKRGHRVTLAHSIADAATALENNAFEYAVVDLNIGTDSGLRFIPILITRYPQCRIVVLTGYASVATAIEAIKLGAVHYLTKPAVADEIIAAFFRDEGNAETPINERPMSLERLEWEHLNKVLQECDGNISAAARKISMHRRTLQRKLRKFPVKH